MTHPITIPLLNPNEPEAHLAGLHVREGQPVSEGDLICTLETTKSISDLHAEAGGFIVGIRFGEGAMVRAGDVLAYVAESPEWTLPVTDAPPEKESATPKNLRITDPARALAAQHDLDLSILPTNTLITVATVEQFIQKSNKISSPNSDFDPTALLIYGGGGHGKTLIELVKAVGEYRIAGIIDDGVQPGEEVLGIPVLGGGDALPALFNSGIRLVVNAVGGIGNIAIRIKVFEQIAANGMACPAIVHPTAHVEPSAELSSGVQVFAHAYVGSEVKVGFGAIVNTGAVVSHDCVIGDYANLSPGVLLAGDVHVEAGVLVGMGVTVNLGVTIGERARIGNGATVKTNVPENGVVRAGTVWPN